MKRFRGAWTQAAGLLWAGLLLASNVASGQSDLVVSESRVESNAVITTVTGAAIKLPAADALPRAPTFHPSRVVVRFKGAAKFLPGSSEARVLSEVQRLHRIDVPNGSSIAEAVAQYRADPNVAYAEPDYVVSIGLAPNDPSFASQQWDMQAIAAPEAWSIYTDSRDVVIAVVDTGIDFNHPDLRTNLYVDSQSSGVHGYTCLRGSCVPGGMDDHGHGTHVAGTIGAAGNNGIGIAGVNWKVQLLAVKILNQHGVGYTSDAVLGFELLRTLKQRGINIRVSNNSWGSGGYSQALFDAMAAVTDMPGYPGTLHVCSAGNNGSNVDFRPMYPAAYSGRSCLSVLATDRNDAIAAFSNFALAGVDLAAPGVSVFSTVPTGNCALCDPSGYRVLSGTSMAAPHVAGVAAALLARQPSLSAAQAHDALLHPDSYDVPGDTSARLSSSGGRLNHYKVLTNNRYLDNPVLNRLPTLSMGPDVTVRGGGVVDFPWLTSDPDGDAVRARLRRESSLGQGLGSFALGTKAGWVIPESWPFTAPNLARTAVMGYDVSVSDNRGGGNAARRLAIILPAASVGRAPTGVLTVPTTGNVGEQIPIQFVAADPEGGQVHWGFHHSGTPDEGAYGRCCVSGNSDRVIFDHPGVYRISAQAIDSELNLSEEYSAVISIGDATDIPPIATAILDRTNGSVPLTVQVDLSQSTDPDGAVDLYCVTCPGLRYCHALPVPVQSCQVLEPGMHWMPIYVSDEARNMTMTFAYVVATPATEPFLTLISSGSPSLEDEVVTLTAHMGGRAPSGSISFKMNGATIAGCGNVILDGAGDLRNAECTTPPLVRGRHAISAHYSGDAANPPIESEPWTQVVITQLRVAAQVPYFLEDGIDQVQIEVFADEAQIQTLRLSARSDNQVLVPDPMLNAGWNGTGGQRRLTISPSADLNGQANLKLKINDAYGGLLRTQFRIEVLPVNDAPRLTLIGNRVHGAGSRGSHAVTGFALANPGPPNESTQTYSLGLRMLGDIDRVVSDAKLSADGTLSYVLSGNNGRARYRVTAQDNGGTANGGIDTTSTDFDIQVGDGLYRDGFER